MSPEMEKITVAPYLAGTVNHSTKNETAKIMVAPYLAAMVNHAMKNKTAKSLTYNYSVELACGCTRGRRS